MTNHSETACIVSLAEIDIILHYNILQIAILKYAPLSSKVQSYIDFVLLVNFYNTTLKITKMHH